MDGVHDTVFLIDVDNTLLDNDRVQADLRSRLADDFGPAAAERYFDLLETLRVEAGYHDYLGALQRLRLERPHEPRLLRLASFLVDYPFAERLFPQAEAVIAHLARWGLTVLLSDGDAVFQPRKIERSGLLQSVDGRVLVYVHKERELADVERKYPARHYVLVDDKLCILTAVKAAWAERVTTIFPRQGHHALDPEVEANFPAADISIARIGELLDHDGSCFARRQR